MLKALQSLNVPVSMYLGVEVYVHEDKIMVLLILDFSMF